MPFGPLIQPSIGLSLLREALPEHRPEIRYYTIPFAEEIGPDNYTWISVLAPNDAAVGDWIFAEALDPQLAGTESRYVDEILRQVREPAPIQDERIEAVLAARATAPGFVARCVDEILDAGPEIVGFSNVFVQQTASLAVARLLKSARPDIRVLFGGANCEGVMGQELIRQFGFVDAAVSGEGDLIIADLVTRLLADGDVADLPGVYTDRNVGGEADPPPPNAPRVEDMDALPVPDYADFFEQWEGSAAAAAYDPVVLLESSRGCWWGAAHHCTFCGLNGGSMQYRSKSADRVMTELQAFADRHPGVFVMAVDNILDARYFRDLIPALAEHPDLQLDLFYALKANLRRDQVVALRDAGIDKIQPGIESLSDTILRQMRKGETALQNIQLLKWCRELGVHAAWNFLWGFPQEPQEEYERMARLVPLLSHLTPPQIAKSVRLDRYSPNYEIGDELGFADIRPCAAYEHVYALPSQVRDNLAYHFDFGYADGRDVLGYTSSLAAGIRQWQQDHRDSELVYHDDAGTLWIWDLRPASEQGLIKLRDLEREIYLACDATRSLGALARELSETGSRTVTAEAIEELTDPLLKRGVMLRDDDRLLSLAVRRPSRTAAAAG